MYILFLVVYIVTFFVLNLWVHSKRNVKILIVNLIVKRISLKLDTCTIKNIKLIRNTLIDFTHQIYYNKYQVYQTVIQKLC